MAFSGVRILYELSPLPSPDGLRVKAVRTASCLWGCRVLRDYGADVLPRPGGNPGTQYPQGFPTSRYVDGRLGLLRRGFPGTLPHRGDRWPWQWPLPFPQVCRGPTPGRLAIVWVSSVAIAQNSSVKGSCESGSGKDFSCAHTCMPSGGSA